MNLKKIDLHKFSYFYIKLLSLFFIMHNCKFMNVELDNFLYLLTIVSSFMLVILNITYKKINFSSKKVKLIFAFFLVKFVMFIFFGFPLEVLQTSIYEFIFLVAIFVCTNLNINDLMKLSRQMVCIVVILDIISIFMLILNMNGVDFGEQYVYMLVNGKMILSGIFTNPNINGILNSLAILFISLNYQHSLKTMDKIRFCFFQIFLLVFVLLTNCRSAQVGLLVCLIVALFHNISKVKILIEKIRKPLFYLLMIFPIFFYAFFVNDFLKEDFENKLNTISATRYDLWKYSFKSMDEKELLFGQINSGENRIREISSYRKNKMGKYYTETMSRNNPHNGFVELFLNNGAICFYIVYYIIISILLFSKYDKVSLIIIFILVTNLFESNLITGRSLINLLLWLFLAQKLKDKIDDNLFLLKGGE